MTISEMLIIGFIFHLIGDYVTQNHWMAVNKTKDSLVAWLHATIYAAPFIAMFVYAGYKPGSMMCIHWSHFFIDRFRLAQYWIRLVNWNWDFESKNHGYPDNVPNWLLIIIDNVLHISINSATIWFFYR
jgi:hypothetical protein